MSKLKVDFWKCKDCDFQTTLESEKIQHEQPYLDETGLHKHTMYNLRFVNC